MLFKWQVFFYYKLVVQYGQSATVGNVLVHYVDESGNTVASDVLDEENKTVSTTLVGMATDGTIITTETTPTGATYNTTDNKPEIITFEGKDYVLVAVKEGDVEEGLVVEGTTEVTYIYKLVTETGTYAKVGNVVVYYVDEAGNTIAADVLDEENTLVSTTVVTRATDGTLISDETIVTGATYNTTDNKPKTITFEGKVYELVAVKEGDVEEDFIV